MYTFPHTRGHPPTHTYILKFKKRITLKFMGALVVINSTYREVSNCSSTIELIAMNDLKSRRVSD